MSDQRDWRTDRDGKTVPSDDKPPEAGSATRARERLSADYDEPEPTRHRSAGKTVTALIGADEMTRKMLYAAAGIGGVLVLGVGGWSLFGGHRSGIPVFGPPPGPVRDKPADPGGMQIMSGEDAAPETAANGTAHVMPGPEQPRPDALAKQYGQSPTPEPKPEPPPSAQPVPAPAPAPAAPSVQAPPAPVPSAPVPPPASAQPAPAVTEEAHPAAPSAAPAPAPSSAGAFMVQLAALDSEADAHRQWDELNHQAPDLFTGRKPVIERIDRDGRAFFRLRLGGFETVQAARAFCVKAHARTIACTPARF